jgi:hypothetical protein
MALLTAALVLTAVGLLFGLHRPRPAPRVDPVAAYDLIRLDEPPGHVEELLGLPAGDYSTGPEGVYIVIWGPYDKARARHPTWKEQRWVLEQYELDILLNEEGMVSSKRLRGRAVPRPLLERLWERVRRGIER